VRAYREFPIARREGVDVLDKLKEPLTRSRSLDQSSAPLADALSQFVEMQYTLFAIPAHKQGRALPHDVVDALGLDVFRHDVPMLNGLDDIHESKQLQEGAQELAAELIGAKQVFYVVNGSTLAIQCAVTAVAGPGEKLLVARNVHKSVISGLIVGGIEPVFLEPEIDDERDLAHGLDPALVARMLDEHPDARGVLAVSPSYYGVASDLCALAEACHERGVPLIGDDAWGAHFPFHPDLPEGSLASGADLAVVSLHKGLVGLQQASALAVRGDLVDPTVVEYRVGLVETSSLTPLILASADLSRRLMALHGEELLERALSLARGAREEIASMDGLDVLGHEVLGRPGAHALDETKLVIDVSGRATNGYDACDWLRNERRVLVELADHRRIEAVVTVGDDEESVRTLVDAVRAIPEGDGAAEVPPTSSLRTELVMRPRDAYFAPGEHVALEKAVGRVVGEKVTPYPPGVPVLVPGERLEANHVEYLRKIVELGANVTDVADSQLETIRVVR
jgi:arginine decarboxylase